MKPTSVINIEADVSSIENKGLTLKTSALILHV